MWGEMCQPLLLGTSKSSACIPQGSFSISCRSDLNLTGIPSHLPLTTPPAPSPAPFSNTHPFPYLMGTHPHPHRVASSLCGVWFPLQPEEEASTLTPCLPAVPVVSPLPFRQPPSRPERAPPNFGIPLPNLGPPPPANLAPFSSPPSRAEAGRSSPFNLGRMQFPASGSCRV